MRRVVKPGRPKKKEVQKERVYKNWKQTASDLAIELELVKQDNDELYSEINKLANQIARLSFEFTPNCVESSKFALGNLKTLLEKTGIVTLQDVEYAESCTERLIVAKVHESFNQFYHDRGIED
jgi:hypothetical protein